MTDTPPPSAPSPCIAICVMDPQSGFCRGCYRTLDEIGRWVLMSRDERLDVLKDVAERRLDRGADAVERERQEKRAQRRAGRRRASPPRPPRRSGE